VSRQRARRYRVAVSAGLILSVLIHVLAVRLSPLVVRYVQPEAALYPVPRPVNERVEGMQVVEIRISEQPRIEPQPEPEPEPEPEQPQAVEAEGEAATVLSAAERLRPTVGDWRLWVVLPVARRRDLTPAERTAEVERRLHALLEEVDDSLAAELAKQAEQMDWTVGEEGNKWGISPGKIHLGPVTLPLPFYVGPGREYEDKIGDYEAIRRQAGQAEIDETFDERRKAIRERNRKAREEAEKEARKKAQKDTTGTR
jgi:hypothetical protein